MTTKVKKHKYQVGGIVKLWSNVEVTAASLDEALELSKTLKSDDFINSDDCNDCQFKVVQVYDPDFDLDI